MSFIKKILIKVFGEKFYFTLRWFLKYGPKYFSLISYWFIEGWLSEKEALVLYRTVKNLRVLNPIVVEIGSWLGKSSVVLAKAVKKKKGFLHCIDPFDASGDSFSKDSYSTKNFDLKEKFLSNIKKAKVEKYVKLIPKKSQDAIKEWNSPIDFIFIDADHTYSNVKEDFIFWSKFLKVGGYIAFHDACQDQKAKKLDGGVPRLIKEEILSKAGWEKVVLVDSLFIAKKLN
ncbi:MAG: class I SAM-dependent methyltransferase [Candidatus Omnitrophica bacterium]|nr:class I SAM-dependent methyltransferase [Candidatus Omnitrophota bacterium]